MPFVDDTPPAGSSSRDELTGRDGALGPVAFTPRDPTDGHSPSSWASWDYLMRRTVPAAFEDGNSVVSAVVRQDGLPTGRSIDPEFDPFQYIHGYEEHASRFAFANTRDEVEAEKRQIDHELANQRVLEASGWTGVAASVVAGVADPVNFIPVGGEASAAYRGGASILKGALATARAGLLSSTASEALLHSSQETRTFGESAANVAGATFLAGVLGAGVHSLGALRPRGVRAFDDLAKGVENDLTVPAPNEPDPITPGFRRVPDAELAADVGVPLEVAPAPAVGPAAVPELPALEPSRLVDISGGDIHSIGVDAQRFQFKGGGDEQGVTERLRGVTQWDQRLAGVSLVFEDDAGKRWIVDGHQRLSLAKRAVDAGQDVHLNAFVMRASAGETPEMAMVVAAVKNIAEGTGSAVDAAKVLRLVESNPELARHAASLPPLPPNSSLVRDARSLANLGDEAFGMVVNRVVPENYAAHVGAGIRDPKEQVAALKVLAKAEPRNVNEARLVVGQLRDEGFIRRQTQGGLFGAEDFADSLVGEKARILDLAGRRIRQDKRLFQALVDKKTAIADAGNVLAHDANQARLTDDQKLEAILASLGTRKGAVGDAVTEAARAVKDGESAGVVVGRLVRDLAGKLREGIPDGPAAGGPGRAAEGAVGDSAGNAAASGEVAPGALSRADIVSILENNRAAVEDALARRAAKGLPPIGTIDDVAAKLEADLADMNARPTTASLIDTPERQALDNDVADRLYAQGGFADGTPREITKGKRIDLVLGPPASGKSSIVDPLAKTHGSLLLDADEAKSMLPEFDGGKGASAVHHESDRIVAGRLLAKAIAGGDNIVWPLVGRGLQKLTDLVGLLSDRGYSVHLHYVDLPNDKAVGRAITRWLETGRLVPPDYVRSVGDAPRATYDALKTRSDVHGYSAVSNDVPFGSAPRLIEAGGTDAVDHAGPGGLPSGHGAGDAQGQAAAAGAQGPGEGGLSLERTPEGLQSVIPGAEPIGTRQLLARRGDASLKADVPQLPANDGLFDVGARNQSELFQPAGGSVGAAATRDTTLAEEGLKSALGLEKALKFQDPLMRAATSPSIETRRVMQDLAESPLTYEKNRYGIATAPGGSVETRIKLWRAPLAKALQTTDDAFVRYRLGRSKRMADLAAIGAQDLAGAARRRGMLTYSEFRDEIGKAMRRGDQHPIPEVSEAAQKWRQMVFDPLKERAIELKLLPEDVTTETATSYLTRLYNTERIAARRPEFVDTVTNWMGERRAQASADLPRLEREFAEAEATKLDAKEGFPVAKIEGEVKPRSLEKIREELDLARERAGQDDLELRDIADQITDRILGTPDGRLPYDNIDVPRPRGRARPDLGRTLQRRAFLIPDETIEPFLESNVELIGRIYQRTMAADVEMTSRFGSVDLVNQLDNIRRDYANKIQAAGSERERVKLQDKRNADIRDVAAVRDRLRGTYALPRDPNSIAIRATRVVKSLNYLRLLGGMTVSSFPDAFRVVMVHGLGRTLSDGLAPLVTDFAKFRMAAEETKLAGTALDMVLDSRAMALADVMDDYGRHSTFERAIHSATTNFGVVSLQAPWNAFWKQFAGAVTMTRILEAAEASHAGAIAGKEIEKLAAGGIDESLARRIHAQFAEHGEISGGLRLANTGQWTDAGAVTAFRSALSRDVDRIIITPGQEKPLWTSTMFGSVVSQFKAFTLSSMQRIVLAGLQDRDLGVLAGTIGMTIAGMGVYALKSLEAGKKTSDNPADWILEGLDRGNVMGWFFEPNNIIEKATRGTVGLKALLGSKQPMSRYASRNVTDALLGPTLGLVEDAAKVTGDAAQAIRGEITGDGRAQWMKSDTRALRRLMPYQSLIGVRHLFDAAEQGIDDNFGVYR